MERMMLFLLPSVRQKGSFLRAAHLSLFLLLSLQQPCQHFLFAEAALVGLEDPYAQAQPALDDSHQHRKVAAAEMGDVNGNGNARLHGSSCLDESEVLTVVLGSSRSSEDALPSLPSSSSMLPMDLESPSAAAAKSTPSSTLPPPAKRRRLLFDNISKRLNQAKHLKTLITQDLGDVVVLNGVPGQLFGLRFLAWNYNHFMTDVHDLNENYPLYKGSEAALISGPRRRTIYQEYETWRDFLDACWKIPQLSEWHTTIQRILKNSAMMADLQFGDTQPYLILEAICVDLQYLLKDDRSANGFIATVKTHKSDVAKNMVWNIGADHHSHPHHNDSDHHKEKEDDDSHDDHEDDAHEDHKNDQDRHAGTNKEEQQESNQQEDPSARAESIMSDKQDGRQDNGSNHRKHHKAARATGVLGRQSLRDLEKKEKRITKLVGDAKFIKSLASMCSAITKPLFYHRQPSSLHMIFRFLLRTLRHPVTSRSQIKQFIKTGERKGVGSWRVILASLFDPLVAAVRSEMPSSPIATSEVFNLLIAGKSHYSSIFWGVMNFLNTLLVSELAETLGRHRVYTYNNQPSQAKDQLLMDVARDMWLMYFDEDESLPLVYTAGRDETKCRHLDKAAPKQATECLPVVPGTSFSSLPSISASNGTENEQEVGSKGQALASSHVAMDNKTTTSRDLNVRAAKIPMAANMELLLRVLMNRSVEITRKHKTQAAMADYYPPVLLASRVPEHAYASRTLSSEQKAELMRQILSANEDPKKWMQTIQHGRPDELYSVVYMGLLSSLQAAKFTDILSALQAHLEWTYTTGKDPRWFDHVEFAGVRGVEEKA